MLKVNMEISKAGLETVSGLACSALCCVEPSPLSPRRYC